MRVKIDKRIKREKKELTQGGSDREGVPRFFYSSKDKKEVLSPSILNV